MIILGITGGHDAGWCIIKDGKILAAYEKERFSRIRHDSGEVVSLIPTTLKDLNISVYDIDMIATSEPVYKNTEPGFLKLSGQKYTRPDEWVFQVIEIFDRIIPCVSVPHHLSHAAYARYTSSFRETAVITWDGGGDFYTEDAYTSTSVSMWTENKLQWLKRIENSDFGSLWDMYSKAIFLNENAAGKLMGLAAYGTNKLVPQFKERFLVPLQGTWIGAYTIKNCWPDYFAPPFISESISWQEEHAKDIAYAIQAITEEAGMSIIKKLSVISNCKNLSIAGGVALNGYLNTAIAKSGLYQNLHIPPSVHDGGICIGAALFVYHHLLENKLLFQKQDLAFLGRQFNKQDTEKCLINSMYHSYYEIDLEKAELKAAKEIVKGKIVAWCNGRSEHGPRALGNRSILGLPHAKDTKDRLNKIIKFREDFRPVAPVVLAEDAKEFFDMDWDSPYMMYIVKANPEIVSKIPSGLHIDNTARVQTVTTADSLGRIVAHIKKLTGIGCVLNTSFNVRTPIVDTPNHALEAFEEVPIDHMYLNGYWITR